MDRHKTRDKHALVMKTITRAAHLLISSSSVRVSAAAASSNTEAVRTPNLTESAISAGLFRFGGMLPSAAARRGRRLRGEENVVETGSS